MKTYMTQDVFNACAVTIACYKDFQPIATSAKEISDIHRKYYIDDGFEEDLITAVDNAVKFMEAAFPGKKVSSGLTQIKYLIEHYHPNGKRKFFKGAWFNRQKTPILDRVKQCSNDLMIYHVGTLSGMFPLAPRK